MTKALICIVRKKSFRQFRNSDIGFGFLEYYWLLLDFLGSCRLQRLDNAFVFDLRFWGSILTQKYVPAPASLRVVNGADRSVRLLVSAIGRLFISGSPHVLHSRIAE